MPLILKKRIVTRAGTLDLLEKLAGSVAVSSRTLYLPPHLVPDALQDMLQEIPADSTVPEKLAEIATGSPTGVVIFCE